LRHSSGRRRELRFLAELCGLCGFVIALPTLDVLGRNPDVLFLEHLTARDVVLLALAVALLPWGAGVVVGLAGRPPRRLAHLATVGGLLVAVAVQVGKHLTPLRGLPLAAAMVAGVVALLWYHREWVRSLLAMVSPVPALAVVLFLFVSPANVLVLPEKTPAASGPAAAGGERPPIVVIAFDEFPLTSLLDTTGRIDAANYPSFAWLAERSSWYRNATGVTTWTRDAYPAMLSGRWPAKPVAAHHRNYPNNLFTLLNGRYELNVHEVASVLCRPPRCNSDPTPPSDGPWRAIRRTDRLAGEIMSMLLPHRPWKYLPSGQRYPETKRSVGFASPTASWPKTLVWPKLARYRHRLQLAYGDRLLGQILQTMQQRGLLDQSVVVVTADHGISFLPNTHPRVASEHQLPPDHVGAAVHQGRRPARRPSR
jgi:hypothetical protein